MTAVTIRQAAAELPERKAVTAALVRDDEVAGGGDEVRRQRRTPP
jgi:hypothetical protein